VQGPSSFDSYPAYIMSSLGMPGAIYAQVM
jgi:hypothetical protein